MEKLLVQCKSKKLDVMYDVLIKIQYREGEVNQYFYKPQKLPDWSFLDPVPGNYPLAHDIINIECDRLVQKQKKKLADEGDEKLVITKFKPPPDLSDPNIDAIWMSSEGLKYDPNIIRRSLGIPPPIQNPLAKLFRK